MDELIKNYGLFWRRSLIGEVWPRTSELLGVGVRKKRAGAVDFARQRGIYALYDDTFRLIYVGQAGRRERGLYGRLRAHTKGNLAERWTRFSWFGLLAVSSELNRDGQYDLVQVQDDMSISVVTAMDHIEAVLIRAAEPLRNSSTGSFGPNVTAYRQFLPGEKADDLGSASNDDDDEL